MIEKQSEECSSKPEVLNEKEISFPRVKPRPPKSYEHYSYMFKSSKDYGCWNDSREEETT